MSRLSQTKSAKLAGCSRATIANRIKDGLLTEQTDGIDIADLVRVFPDISSNRIEQFLAGTLPSKDSDDSEVAAEVAAAKEREAELLVRNEELEAEKAAADEQRLAANNWAKGLSDRMVEQQANLIKQQAEQLESVQKALNAKDQTIETLTNKITALLPAPEPETKPEPPTFKQWLSGVFG